MKVRNEGLYEDEVVVRSQISQKKFANQQLDENLGRKKIIK